MALKLYDRLSEPPVPRFAASRMKLSCIVYELPPLSRYPTCSGYVYRADTVAFGMVKIGTKDDLSRMDSLYLIHPWLDTLFEHEDEGGGIVGEDVLPPSSPDTDDEEVYDDGTECLPEPEPPPHPPHARMVPMDKETRARLLVAHPRQPFGALLVTLASRGGGTVDYKRVAADSVITVQFQKHYSLADILDNVCMLHVL